MPSLPNSLLHHEDLNPEEGALKHNNEQPRPVPLRLNPESLFSESKTNTVGSEAELNRECDSEFPDEPDMRYILFRKSFLKALKPP